DVVVGARRDLRGVHRPSGQLRAGRRRDRGGDEGPGAGARGAEPDAQPVAARREETGGPADQCAQVALAGISVARPAGGGLWIRTLPEAARECLHLVAPLWVGSVCGDDEHPIDGRFTHAVPGSAELERTAALDAEREGDDRPLRLAVDAPLGDDAAALGGGGA